MFVRVKTTPKSPRKSVQIVESKRVDGKVKQRIVQHIGVALDDNELEELKALAASIKIKLELDEQLPLYSIEEIEKLEEYNKRNSPSKKVSLKNNTTPTQSQKQEVLSTLDNRDDYNVNLLDIIEEERVIKGIHDIYGKMYDELGFDRIISNPARNVKSNKTLKEMVLSRVANPNSKRGSVLDLQENYGVHLDLNAVYRMMDKIGDKEILKLNQVVYDKTRALFQEKIDVAYTTLLWLQRVVYL